MYFQRFSAMKNNKNKIESSRETKYSMIDFFSSSVRHIRRDKYFRPLNDFFSSSVMRMKNNKNKIESKTKYSMIEKYLLDFPPLDCFEKVLCFCLITESK